MSKLGFELPADLEFRLRKYIPWGSKGAIITELLWQLADKADKDGGKCVYELIQQSVLRSHATPDPN